MKKLQAIFKQILQAKKKLFLSLTVLMFLLGTIPFLINFYLNQSTQAQIYADSKTVPAAQTALLLGSLVYDNGKLSPIMQDRADTAIELYQNAKVKKILISGDHGRKNYDEVNTIKNYLLEKGVKAEDIFMDHAGFDTYDSVYRADYIFDVESVIIVSQNFHLNRSLYLANSLGIKAVGISADKRIYYGQQYNNFREFFAKIKAFKDILFHAKPKFLGEKIPITGDSQKSWD